VKYCEYNPFEAVRTNIMGTQNMILNALEENVEKVVFSSSDKAVNPSNALGASKLMAERLMTAANGMRGRHRTVFASVRFGNVIGSGGSVLPLFINQIRAGGPVTVTHPSMTRFIMSLRQAVGLMLKASQMAQGGEVFTLRMPAVRIQDLAQVMIDEIGGGMPIPIKFIGTKPGEKIDEELLTEDELKRSEMLEDMYVTYPTNPDERPPLTFGGILPPNHSYCSKDNGMLDRDGIRHFLEDEGLLESDGTFAFRRIPRFEWRGA
jgi:UDP-N-acetylglucosamine 4,6-dehydratase/5-epimerase